VCAPSVSGLDDLIDWFSPPADISPSFFISVVPRAIMGMRAWERCGCSVRGLKLRWILLWGFCLGGGLSFPASVSQSLSQAGRQAGLNPHMVMSAWSGWCDRVGMELAMEMEMASARAQTMDIQNVVVDGVFWCLVFSCVFGGGRGLGRVGSVGSRNKRSIRSVVFNYMHDIALCKVR
jgi:hypothetical protein